MTPAEHIHKYIRVVYKSGWTIYKCVLNCTHFVDSKQLTGRSCLCWRCGEAFQLNNLHTQLKKPHCNDCRKVRKEVKGIKELRKMILGE